MEGYDPGLPRVRRICLDLLIAILLQLHFDDCWAAGPTKLLAKQALRQATAGAQHLGSQGASRKRQRASQWAGAWAGSVTCTDQGMAQKLITQEKWDKAAAILDWVYEHVEAGRGMDRKQLWPKMGLLLRIVKTYDVCQPCIQGFFLSENAWQSGRDADGCRLQAATARLGSEPDDAEKDDDNDTFEGAGAKPLVEVS